MGSTKKARPELLKSFLDSKNNKYIKKGYLLFNSIMVKSKTDETIFTLIAKDGTPLADFCVDHWGGSDIAILTITDGQMKIEIE
jgi:hypothetical protein